MADVWQSNGNGDKMNVKETLNQYHDLIKNQKQYTEREHIDPPKPIKAKKSYFCPKCDSSLKKSLITKEYQWCGGHYYIQQMFTCQCGYQYAEDTTESAFVDGILYAFSFGLIKYKEFFLDREYYNKRFGRMIR